MRLRESSLNWSAHLIVIFAFCILPVMVAESQQSSVTLDPSTFAYNWGENRVKLEVEDDRLAVYFPQVETPVDHLLQVMKDYHLDLGSDSIEETPYQGLLLLKTGRGNSQQLLEMFDSLADGWAAPCLDFRGRLHIPTPEILVTLDPDDPAAYDRILSRPDLHLIREFPSITPLLHLSFSGFPRQIEETLEELKNFSGVTSASPNFIMHLAPMAVPNDPFFGSQWFLENTGQAGNVGVDISAAAAWGIQTGSLSVRVSIIDEGVDVFHEDLAAHIVAGHDSTNQASPAGVAGNCASTDGHGTACAGLAAGIGDNGIGIAGVAWAAEIQPVRLGFGNHWTENSWIIDALTWASDNGGDILSNSWGGGSPTTAEQNTLQYALDTGRGGLGCILVFASGNDNLGVSFPAAYTQAIAVGASSPCDERKSPSSCDGETWWGSNFGTEQSVVAPGVLMATTDISGAGGYVTGGATADYVGNFNGTSSATPVTAGALAVILAQDATLTAAEARTILESGADDQVGPPGEDTPGFDNSFGHGRINLANMLALMGGPAGPDNFTCVEEPLGVQLSWTNGEAYDEIRVMRDGILLATVPGSTTGYLDVSVPIGQRTWELQGFSGGVASLSATCSTFLLGDIRDLVWAPETGTTDSGVALTNALVASGRSVVTAGSIFALPDLDRLDRIWVQLGMFPNNHQLTTLEAEELDLFLTNGVGGKAVFMEGGDTWFFDTQTIVHSRFGITALSDGASTDNLGTVDGVFSPGCDLSSLSFDYAGENTWVDRISAAAGSGVVQSNQAPAYDVAVFRDSGTFYTFGSSYEIGGLTETTATRQQLVEAIIDCMTDGVDPPTNLGCSTGGSTVTVTWTNPGGWDSVEVTLDGGTPQALAGGATSTSISALASGSHSVSVVSVVGAVASVPVTCNFGIDPQTPSSVACQVQGSDVSVSWVNSEVYDSIDVIRDGQTVATLAGTATSHLDVAPGGGIHQYLIQGVVGGFNSAPSGCGASINPIPVTSFTCLRTGNLVDLQWVNGDTYDSITVFRNGTILQTLGGGVTSLADAPGSGSHLYTIRGTISGLNSTDSSCSAELAPAAPTAFSCAVASGQVTLQWTNPETYTQISVTRDGVQIALLAGTAVTHLDVSPGAGQFQYGVSGVTESVPSTESLCTASIPPQPITNLDCSQNSGTVSIFWSEGTGLDGIEVRRDGTLIATVAPAVGFYQETGVAAGTHLYSLRAVSGVLSSTDTDCTLVLPPAAVSGLTCISNSPLTAQLDWVSPVGATSITILKDGVLLDTVSADITSYLDSSAAAGIRIYALFAEVGAISGPSTSCGVSVDSPTPPPVSSFTASVSTGVAPLGVTFTDTSSGSIDSWQWTFGDGGSSSLQNPTHQYSSDGSFTAILLVTGPGGSDSSSIVITVDPAAPVADFSGTPTSGTHPLTVAFSDLSSGGPTSGWSWTFGDGATSTLQNPSHTYSAAGSYTVSMTTSGPGGSDTLTRTAYITVAEPAPIADFSGTPTSGTHPLTVVFSDLSSGGPTSGWSWTFGDGVTSTLQNPSHTYTAAGSYTVSMTTSGPGGSDTLTRTAYITVAEPAPIADFSGTPTSGTTPLTVAFSDLSGGGPVADWSWTFGDGATSTLQNPSHTYTVAGTYDVQLTVSGPGGSDTLSRLAYVAVVDLPQFIRGDGNGDGQLDVSDAVQGLDFLFGSGAIDCHSALDCNDDSTINLADVVFVLGSVFGSNSLPSAPYPACGPDPTADALDCVSSASCP